MNRWSMFVPFKRGSLHAEGACGIIPVNYRRVPCVKKGGIRVEITGNQFSISVLVFNIAGSDEVKAMVVKGSKNRQWTAMKRNWGQIWDAELQSLVHQALLFRVVASDGRFVVLNAVIPVTWAIGQNFEGKAQFSYSMIVQRIS